MKNVTSIFSSTALLAMVFLFGAGCDRPVSDQQTIQDQQQKIDALTQKVDELNNRVPTIATTTSAQTSDTAATTTAAAVQPTITKPKPIIRKQTPQPEQTQYEDSMLKIERCKVSAQEMVDADKKAELPALMQLARDSCETYPDGTDICWLNKLAVITELKEGIWAKSSQRYYGDCINQ